MNKREGCASSSLVTATFFQKNEPNLSHSNIFDVFYMISCFLHNFLLFVEKLQPFYIEMAPSRSPQALQHFWYVFYFVTLSPFLVEKLQAFYIGIAPSSSPQALQHSWYWFYFVMCLHPVSFFCWKTPGLLHRNGSQKDPPSLTATFQGISKNHPEAPKDRQGAPKSSQGAPRDPPGALQSSQRHSKSPQGRPKSSQATTKPPNQLFLCVVCLW